jgi:predicted nucleic acid-binding protein
MRSVAILDAGPLVAAADANDPNHARSLEVLRRRDLDFVIPALVVAEVAYLIGSRLDATKEVAFLRGLRRFAIEPPADDDWPLIADLVERYADFPLGTTDAATVALADRLGTDLIVTLDRRHFGAVRSPTGRHFRLLPETLAVHEEPATYEATSA